LDDPPYTKESVNIREEGLCSTPSLDFGDAADDMTAATILLLVGGQLVLLTPRKVCPIFVVKEVTVFLPAAAANSELCKRCEI
jgi:hypothetical protein